MTDESIEDFLDNVEPELDEDLLDELSAETEPEAEPETESDLEDELLDALTMDSVEAVDSAEDIDDIEAGEVDIDDLLAAISDEEALEDEEEPMLSAGLEAILSSAKEREETGGEFYKEDLESLSDMQESDSQNEEPESIYDDFNEKLDAEAAASGVKIENELIDEDIENFAPELSDSDIYGEMLEQEDAEPAEKSGENLENFFDSFGADEDNSEEPEVEQSGEEFTAEDDMDVEEFLGNSLPSDDFDSVLDNVFENVDEYNLEEADEDVFIEENSSVDEFDQALDALFEDKEPEEELNFEDGTVSNEDAVSDDLEADDSFEDLAQFRTEAREVEALLDTSYDDTLNDIRNALTEAVDEDETAPVQGTAEGTGVISEDKKDQIDRLEKLLRNLRKNQD